MNSKGLILAMLIVVITGATAGYYLFKPRTTNTLIQTSSFKDSTVNENIQQGIYGTVLQHIYGCGQLPPDGSGCDTVEINEVLGEGEQVTVYVIDKTDSYGNVNLKHSIVSYYTDKKGTYRAYLDPGTYILCLKDRDCSQIIEVESGKFSEVNLTVNLPRP